MFDLGYHHASALGAFKSPCQQIRQWLHASDEPVAVFNVHVLLHTTCCVFVVVGDGLVRAYLRLKCTSVWGANASPYPAVGWVCLGDAISVPWLCALPQLWGWRPRTSPWIRTSQTVLSDGCMNMRLSASSVQNNPYILCILGNSGKPQ